MASATYGYIRVSTKEQNTDRQLDALQSYGIAVTNLYSDKQSGKNFDRPQYKQMLKKIRKGDCVVITSLDRLGRNYTEIQEEWRRITKVLQADIIVLDMPLLNTKQAENNLLGRFLADMVLQILSYVAETERHNIKKRQKEGIASAKARGIKFGRREKPLPQDFYEVIKQWQTGQISARAAARRMQVSTAWLYRKFNALTVK